MRFVDDHDNYGVIRTCIEDMLENGKDRSDIEEMMEEILAEAEENMSDEED